MSPGEFKPTVFQFEGVALHAPLDLGTRDELEELGSKLESIPYEPSKRPSD